MSKYQVKRPRHLRQIERLDEQPRVPDLPTAAAAHEAPKLFLRWPPLPRRLLLEGAEGSKVSVGVNDLLHASRTESADQLVLQIYDAHVETESFHVGTSEVGAEAGPLETALELAFLCGIAETRERDVKPSRSEPIQKPSDRLRTPDWHNGNAFSVEVPTTALGERFECALIAGPLDENDRMQVGVRGRRL